MRDYVRKAADPRPVLEQNQAAGDSDRRLTDEAMAAMRDAGELGRDDPGGGVRPRVPGRGAQHRAVLL